MKKHIYVVYGILTAIVVACIFFILYNANWLIGDDAIIMRRSGMGQMFSCADTTKPELGRFFPFTYLMYNILCLFSGGAWISAISHYVLHSICFVVFVIILFSLMRRETQVFNDKLYVWAAFLLVVVVIERTIGMFINCYSTAWFAVTIVSIFLYSTYRFYACNKSLWYGLLSILAINYFTYMIEIGFVIPFSIGFSALLFGWKKLSKREKVFNVILLGISVVFLLNYYFIVFRHTTAFYDPAHGEDVSIIGNVIKMLLSQKMLILVFGAFLWRIYRVFIKKDEFLSLYDSLLSGAVVASCGAFFLRLNWNLYYIIFVLIALPSLMHYACQYMNHKVVLAICLLLCLFFAKSAVRNVSTNQRERIQDVSIINELVDMHKSGKTLVWYVLPTDNADFVIDDWQRLCVQTYIAYVMEEESFELSTDITSDNAVVIHLASVKSSKPAELEEYQFIKSLGEYELYETINNYH